MSDAPTSVEQLGRNPPLVNMVQLMWEVLPAGSWGKEYRQQMETVAMVVLPNAEMALTLERPRADALLRSRTTRDPVDIEPDPWRGGYCLTPEAKEKEKRREKGKGKGKSDAQG